MKSKVLSVAAVVFLTQMAAARGTGVACENPPGQLIFNLSADGLSASVTQRRYALQDGPATDLARQLQILPPSHLNPGISMLTAVSGQTGLLIFSLTDGTVRKIQMTNLTVALSKQVINGVLNTVLIFSAEGRPMLSIGLPTTECEGD